MNHAKLIFGASALIVLVFAVLYYPTHDRITQGILTRYSQEIQTLSDIISQDRKNREDIRAEFNRQDSILSGSINTNKIRMEKLQLCLSAKSIDCEDGKKEAMLSLIPQVNADNISNGTAILTPVSEVPLGIKSTSQISPSVPKKTATITSAPIKSVAEDVKKPSVVGEKPKLQKVEGNSSNYWTAYEVAISQIQKWEGLRLTAYWDHAGYSVGYGTRAKSSNEKITRAEADKRLVAIVKPLLAKVQADFPNMDAKGQGALVSFAYNCHSGYVAVRNKGLSQHSQWCKTASGKVLSGLVARRAEESRILFSKN